VIEGFKTFTSWMLREGLSLRCYVKDKLWRRSGQERVGEENKRNNNEHNDADDDWRN